MKVHKRFFLGDFLLSLIPMDFVRLSLWSLVSDSDTFRFRRHTATYAQWEMFISTIVFLCLHVVIVVCVSFFFLFSICQHVYKYAFVSECVCEVAVYHVTKVICPTSKKRTTTTQTPTHTRTHSTFSSCDIHKWVKHYHYRYSHHHYHHHRRCYHRYRCRRHHHFASSTAINMRDWPIFAWGFG